MPSFGIGSGGFSGGGFSGGGFGPGGGLTIAPIGGGSEFSPTDELLRNIRDPALRYPGPTDGSNVGDYFSPTTGRRYDPTTGQFFGDPTPMQNATKNISISSPPRKL